jgi:hypothetical protein
LAGGATLILLHLRNVTLGDLHLLRAGSVLGLLAALLIRGVLGIRSHLDLLVDPNRPLSNPEAHAESSIGG